MKTKAPICAVGMTTGLASLMLHAVTNMASRLPTIKPASNFFNIIVSFLALRARAVPIPLEVSVIRAVFLSWACLLEHHQHQSLIMRAFHQTIRLSPEPLLLGEKASNTRCHRLRPAVSSHWADAGIHLSHTRRTHFPQILKGKPGTW